MKSAMSTIRATGQSSDHRTAPARKRGRALIWIGAGVAVALLLAVVALGAVGLWLASKGRLGVKLWESPVAGTPVQPAATKPGSDDATEDKRADKPGAAVVASSHNDKQPVIFELTDLTRTSDGCLKASFRFRNTTAKPITLDTVSANLFRTLYYVDPNTKRACRVMRQHGGKIEPAKDEYDFSPLVAFDAGWIKAPANDVTQTYWAKLQGPDDGAQKATFYLNGYEPMEDVPLPPAK